MRYSAAVALLESLQGGAIHPGLTTTRNLLRALGHPEQRFRAVHLAGTNGKGSTSAMIERILRTAGYRTGLYTSPHIHDFTERIRLCGAPIPRRDVAISVAAHAPLFRRTACTYFEAATVLAFDWFARQQIEAAVIETGLGGRWDSTSTVEPDCTIITSIGLDHVDILGRSLVEIAMEKAGIFRTGVPAVIGPCPQKVRTRLYAAAAERGTPLRESARETRIRCRSMTIEGSRFDYRDSWGGLPDLVIPLAGAHQIANATVAVYAVRWLKARGWRISDDDVRDGLRAVHWPGRLQVIRRHPLILADVTHNPPGAHVTVKTLRRLQPRRRWRIVFGLLQSKDLRGILRAFKPLTDTLYVFTLPAHRAVPAGHIAAAAAALRIPAVICDSGLQALQAALLHCPENRGILITGSHHALQNVF